MWMLRSNESFYYHCVVAGFYDGVRQVRGRASGEYPAWDPSGRPAGTFFVTGTRARIRCRCAITLFSTALAKDAQTTVWPTRTSLWLHDARRRPRFDAALWESILANEFRAFLGGADMSHVKISSPMGVFFCWGRGVLSPLTEALSPQRAQRSRAATGVVVLSLSLSISLLAIGKAG